MKLENINCKWIKVTSDYLMQSELVKYNRLDIEVKYNCCDELYTDTIDISTSRWRAVLPLKHILQVNVKNIISDWSYNLLEGSTYDIGSCNDSNSQTMVTNITTVLRDKLNNPNVQVSVTNVNGICYLEVRNLVYPLVMDTIQYKEGADFTRCDLNMFYSLSSPFGNFITGEGLYINEQMFGFDKLLDGIYKVKLKFSTYAGNVIEEESCFFYDDLTKCKLASKLKELADEKIETDLHMIHYALTSAANCKCYCTEMCKLYEYLYNQLNSKSIDVDCGCRK